MKTIKLTLLFIGIIFSVERVFSQTDTKIFFGDKYLIHSEILRGDREYWVHLPMDYEKGTKDYPVLYITDGDEHFFLASGLTEFMSSQFIIPEFIVVAIIHKDRNHDLTPTHCLTDINGIQSDAAKVSGGGEKLLQFIEQELIVQIEDRFRASSYRILAGHSLGGLFCTYAYLSRNILFKGFISMDPAFTPDIPFILDFYKNVSDVYGMEVSPPEYLIEMLGKYFLYERMEYPRAIELFKLNTINYPDSYKSFNFLAKAYEASGDMDHAILNYKKSLELNPGNTDIRQAISELEQE
ncbi:MAG: hypothetical protein JW801_02560 [Bacteroidales bacterium]|nr:hypothetical protein [Bacteroidales bacterium]